MNSEFEKNGYCVINLQNRKYLGELQSLVAGMFPEPLDSWDGHEFSFDEHVEFVHRLNDKVIESGFAQKLLANNIGFFVEVLGPDIDVQANPHIRISRPGCIQDLISWHRDTFYGSSPYELNVWFPLVPLPANTGLRVVPGSHVLVPKEVRDIEASVKVSKGSVANKIGFLYAPKTDEYIERLSPGDSNLIAPQVGQALVFFASAIHGPQNGGGLRISIDIRVRSPFAPTNTKPGYYVPLRRGVVHNCASRFLGTEITP